MITVEQVTCEFCSGTGNIDCPICEGKGWYYYTKSIRMACPNCGGTGVVPCNKCGGKGWYYEFEVK